jgi:hypothetical protein
MYYDVLGIVVRTETYYYGLRRSTTCYDVLRHSRYGVLTTYYKKLCYDTYDTRHIMTLRDTLRRPHDVLGLVQQGVRPLITSLEPLGIPQVLASPCDCRETQILVGSQPTSVLTF